MAYPDGFSLSHEGAKGSPLQTEDSSGRSLLFIPAVHVQKKVWMHNSDCWQVVVLGNNLFFLTLQWEYYFWYRQASEFENQLKLKPPA